MYLQGVSTRKVAKVMNEICGGNRVSAAYVSQCTTQLDDLFEKWRYSDDSERPLLWKA
jgi:transposase-like protein